MVILRMQSSDALHANLIAVCMHCTLSYFQSQTVSDRGKRQSYEIKSPPWTILWFRILEIFSVENIKRLCVFIFQTWDNSQLLRRVLWISAELTIVSSLKHKNTQPLYIFNRVRVLHLDRLKEGTWVHRIGYEIESVIVFTYFKSKRLNFLYN